MTIMITNEAGNRPVLVADNLDLTRGFVRGDVIEECVAGCFLFKPHEVVHLSKVFGAETIVRRVCSCGTIVATGPIRPEIRQYRYVFVEAAKIYDVPISFGDFYDLSLLSLVENMLCREAAIRSVDLPAAQAIVEGRIDIGGIKDDGRIKASWLQRTHQLPIQSALQKARLYTYAYERWDQRYGGPKWAPLNYDSK